MRVVGVDYGFRRIGIAVAETEPFIASPRPSLTASGVLRKDAEAIAHVARVEEATKIVLGLPIEPSGEEGRMARICRTLGEKLEALGFEVVLVDERLSTVEAEAVLQERGLKASRRRTLIDGQAAGILLSRYLDAQTAP